MERTAFRQHSVFCQKPIADLNETVDRIEYKVEPEENETSEIRVVKNQSTAANASIRMGETSIPAYLISNPAARTHGTVVMISAKDCMPQ